MGFALQCENENCTFNYDNDEYKLEYSVEYKAFYLDHQNKSSPFREKYDDFYGLYNYFDLTLTEYNWRNIIYKEKIGFFQKEKKTIIGFVENHSSSFTVNYNESILWYNNTYYKVFHILHINNDHKIEDEYERKEVSAIDFIANAISYFPNVFSVLKFIFLFYSQNFNNYKIVEKILSKKNNKDIELLSLQRKNKSNIEELIIKESNEEKDDEKKSGLLDEDKSIEKGNEIKLTKLRFIHFFLENFYCKSCSKYTPQELIHICNTILLKYLSVDSILYNQILLLENLFKDYKWNNPELNKLDSNKLIIELILFNKINI